MGNSRTYSAGAVGTNITAEPNGPCVDYVRPEVCDKMEDWQTIDDCLDGERSIKGYRKEKYLPNPYIEGGYGMRPRPYGDDEHRIASWSAMSNNQALLNERKYQDYVERACYLNVPQQTLQAMIGEVFKHEVKINLPKSLEPLVKNIDGKGVSLVQQAKGLLAEGLSSGRFGLLVDYPRNSESGFISKADLDSGKVRATINRYDKYSIINWDEITIGADRVTSLVMLREQYVVEAKSSRYKKVYAEQIRELALENVADDEESPIYQYIQRVWRKVKNEKGEEYWEQFGDDVYPTDYAGKAFDYIPFFIFGAQRNDWEIDACPLLDLCKLSIYHYRNSADVEHTAHMLAHPTTVIRGATQDELYDEMGGVVPLGGVVVLPDAQRCDFKFEEIAPNTLSRELMKDKEGAYLTLGAKIATQQTVRKTATQTELEALGGTCVLVSNVTNLNSVYNDAMKAAGQFHGVEVEDKAIAISTEIVMTSFDAQQLLAIATGIQTNVITLKEGREKAIELGMASADWDQYMADKANEPDFVAASSTAGGGGNNQAAKTSAARSENAI